MRGLPRSGAGTVARWSRLTSVTEGFRHYLFRMKKLSLMRYSLFHLRRRAGRKMRADDWPATDKSAPRPAIDCRRLGLRAVAPIF